MFVCRFFVVYIGFHICIVAVGRIVVSESILLRKLELESSEGKDDVLSIFLVTLV